MVIKNEKTPKNQKVGGKKPAKTTTKTTTKTTKGTKSKVTKGGKRKVTKGSWIWAVGKARKELGITGFVAIKKGTELYNRAKELQNN